MEKTARSLLLRLALEEETKVCVHVCVCMYVRVYVYTRVCVGYRPKLEELFPLSMRHKWCHF